MRPGGRRSSRGGFTLFEVMASVAVLVLVFVSALGAITIGFRILEDARLSTLASQVLQSEMENLRLKNWSQLSDMPASSTFTVESSLGSDAFDKFTCRRAIRDVRTDLKQVVLTLTWISMGGQEHTRSYTTLISNDGLNDYYYRKL